MIRRLLAALLVSISPATVLADVAIPGYTRVPHEVLVSNGELADRCLTAIRVKEGDNLSKIARERLGAASRVDEIVAVNRGLSPDRIHPGDIVLIPPKAPAPGIEPLVLYYRSGPGGYSQAELVVEGVPLRGHYMAAIYAVPLAKRSQFEAMFEDRKNRPEPEDVQAALGVAISTHVNMGIQLPKAKAPAKIETHVKLKKITGQVLEIDSQDRHLNEDGEVIDSADQAAAMLPFIGIGLAGMLGAALLGWRRRKSQVS
ncbi:MAG: LysM peptidoglycan-binding domain-containing protein [Planctomycetota bacterium]